MNIMASARTIGLMTDDHRPVSGTIDEATVRASIARLSSAHAGDDDLFADAARRVQFARSAGRVPNDATSVLHPSPVGTAVQLRYRAEMAAIFTDLAIDVGLRNAARLTDAAV